MRGMHLVFKETSEPASAVVAPKRGALVLVKGNRVAKRTYRSVRAAELRSIREAARHWFAERDRRMGLAV
jgi:hypothetical protein